FFFFSSRRRHTRSKRDWSSDVCSSDLHAAARTERLQNGAGTRITGGVFAPELRDQNSIVGKIEVDIAGGQSLPRLPNILARCKRSEERRVGKEWRSRRAP